MIGEGSIRAIFLLEFKGAGPDVEGVVELFGVRLVGVTEITGQKVLLTLIFLVAIYGAKKILTLVLEWIFASFFKRKARFWSRQGLNLAAAVLIILSVLSIWFDDPARLTTGIGLMTAGLAFALQKVILSLAGYLMIMRGNTFTVGERITMGGIRGDVIRLGFLQTTIMEMGQPPSVQGAVPAMWVRGRQFTGRIVTVTNDKVFDEPVYNYSRDFPFIWEEISVPVKYDSPRERVEAILLEIVEGHTSDLRKRSDPWRADLERKYGVKTDDVVPRVFLRMTDNWIECTVRFIVEEHGVRDIKDAITRDLLTEFERAGIQIASATFEITGLPDLSVKIRPSRDGEGI